MSTITLELELIRKLECDFYHEHYAVFIKSNVPHDKKIRHNPFGFAVCRPDANNIKWFCFDKQIFKTEDFCLMSNLSEEDTLFYHLTYGDDLPSNLENVHPNHNPLLNMDIIVLP